MKRILYFKKSIYLLFSFVVVKTAAGLNFTIVKHTQNCYLIKQYPSFRALKLFFSLWQSDFVYRPSSKKIPTYNKRTRADFLLSIWRVTDTAVMNIWIMWLSIPKMRAKILPPSKPYASMTAKVIVTQSRRATINCSLKFMLSRYIYSSCFSIYLGHLFILDPNPSILGFYFTRGCVFWKVL